MSIYKNQDSSPDHVASLLLKLILMRSVVKGKISLVEQIFGEDICKLVIGSNANVSLYTVSNLKYAIAYNFGNSQEEN